MRSLFSLIVAGLLAAAPAPAAPKPKEKETAPKSEKVDRMFAEMKDGTYRGDNFPALGWEDIPALLERAGEEGSLKTFPVNPISSLGQRECREGVVALWLVEGIRIGGKFPSLNPRFSGARGPAGASPEEQRAAVEAYRAWWAAVKGQPPEKARESNPLAGPRMSWY